MSKKSLVSFLSLIFTFTLLFPMGISFAHAFEKHHFKDCEGSLQFHTHENKINCSVYHYTTSFQTTASNNVYSILIPKIIKIEVIPLFSTLITLQYPYKQLRAPPVFVN